MTESKLVVSWGWGEGLQRDKRKVLSNEYAHYLDYGGSFMGYARVKPYQFVQFKYVQMNVPQLYLKKAVKHTI